MTQDEAVAKIVARPVVFEDTVARLGRRSPEEVADGGLVEIEIAHDSAGTRVYVNGVRKEMDLPSAWRFVAVRPEGFDDGVAVSLDLVNIGNAAVDDLLNSFITLPPAAYVGTISRHDLDRRCRYCAAIRSTWGFDKLLMHAVDRHVGRMTVEVLEGMNDPKIAFGSGRVYATDSTKWEKWGCTPKIRKS